MTRIRYIGLKPEKADNVAQSGAVWHGPGDIQEVSEAAARKLLAFTSVWEEAGETVADSAEPTPREAASVVAALDALRTEAKGLGVKVNGTWRESRLLKEIEAARAAASGGSPQT